MTRLAQRIVEVSRSLATPTPVIALQSDNQTSEDDDQPGLLDLLASGEEALPQLNERLEEITGVLSEIASLAHDSSLQMEQPENQTTFARRVRLTRELARRLMSPAQRMHAASAQYARTLTDVDLSVHAALDLVEESLETASPEDRAEAAIFAQAVDELANVAIETATPLEELIETLRRNAKLSRDLRQPAAQMQAALREFLDGNAVMAEWQRRIQELGLLHNTA